MHNEDADEFQLHYIALISKELKEKDFRNDQFCLYQPAALLR